METSLLSIGTALLLSSVIIMKVCGRGPLGRFRTDGRALIAPPHVWQMASSSLTAIGFFVLSAHDFSFPTTAFIPWVSGTLFMILAIIMTLYACSARTGGRRLLIRPDGIEVRGIFRVHGVTWSGLDDPFAMFDAGLRGPGIPIRGIKPTGALINLRALDVHPSEVLAGIYYYRDHPQYRPAIGQSSELQRFYAPA